MNKTEPYLTVDQLKRSVEYLYSLGSKLVHPGGETIATAEAALFAMNDFRDCPCGAVAIPGQNHHPGYPSMILPWYPSMPIYMCPHCCGRWQRLPDGSLGVDLEAADSMGFMAHRFISDDGQWLIAPRPE